MAPESSLPTFCGVCFEKRGQEISDNIATLERDPGNGLKEEEEDMAITLKAEATGSNGFSLSRFPTRNKVPRRPAAESLPNLCRRVFPLSLHSGTDVGCEN